MEFLNTYMQNLEQHQYILWEKSPFAVANDIELLESLKSSTTGEGLEKEYKSLRKDILESGDDAFNIGIWADSKAGGSTVLMNMRRIIKDDLYLERQLRRRGKTLNVVTAPISIYAYLVREGDVLPQYQVKNKEQYTLTSRDAVKISALATDETEAYIKSRPSNEKTVIIREAGARTSYPVVQDGNLYVVGFDRGHSSAVYLPGFEQPQNFKGFYVAKNEFAEGNIANPWRRELFSEDPNLLCIFNGDIDVIFSSVEGEVISVGTLCEQEQREIVVFMRNFMGNPKTSTRSERSVAWNMRDLWVRDYIKSPTEEEYVAYLRQTLNLPKKKLVKTINDIPIGGRKVYDLDVYFDSVPVIKHPELVQKFLPTILQRHLTPTL